MQDLTITLPIDLSCHLPKYFSCDQTCAYWTYNSSCSAVRFTYIFDNYFTLAYAFLVAIWATTFLEFWNRKNFELIYDWDLSRIDEDQEPIRIGFQQ